MKGLLAAVNQPFGTAYWQRLPDLQLAGKTGTAQVVKMGAKRLRADQVDYFERDHAWFAVFAPAEDPQIVVVVLNEHSGFGSTNAAPTAVALVKSYFQLKARDEAERGGVVPDPPRSSPPPSPPPVLPGRADRPKLGALAPDQGADRG
jgi:penicillin-binding protein 2